MKIILHICCGVCAAGAVSQLLQEGHEVVGYFFNPNIHPSDEYARRLEAAKTVCSELKIPLKVSLYNPDQWLKETAAYAGEKEGGQRCKLCYRIRLQSTYAILQEEGADAFASTLTVGPRKSAEIINGIGKAICGEKFVARDFKKKEGFKKAGEIARRLGIYRQNYCGCIYSLSDNAHKRT